LLRSKEKGFCFEAANKTLDLVMQCKLSGKEAGDAISCVGEHLSSFSDKAQLNLLREIVESLETEKKHDGVVFEILGRVLSRQTVKEDVGVIDFDGETFSSPSEFRARVITSLTAASWSATYTVNLLGVFKDALLMESEQKQICDKGLFMLGQVDYAVLPSLVYQLLLFKYKNKGEVIVKIAEFFEGLEAKVRSGKLQPQSKVEQLRQIEGTVLLHVDVALKQDSSLASSFLKTLQKESDTRSTFMTAFLLALSRSPRHQDAVMKLLMAMVTSGTEDLLANSHAWSNGALKQGERPPGAVKAMLMETIARAQNGWQVIVQPIMTLALACLENKSRNKVLADSMRSLGSEMLETTFRLHESVQGEILSQIFSRIASTGPETPAFIHFLSVLVSKFKHQVMHSELKLREAFEYLTYLKPSVGLQLVDAILPLMTGTKAFQDHLMIVFRKAMFRGDLQSRLTAVGGFARWITHETLEADVAYDILGFLNRALTQQKEVRVVV
jgi:Fanconi anemia group I protein